MNTPENLFATDDPIEINTITESISSLRNPNDEYVGLITNSLQLNDIRVQIAEKELSGYYIRWSDQRIDINSDGFINNWPSGWYDIEERQLATLFRIQHLRKSNKLDN